MKPSRSMLAVVAAISVACSGAAIAAGDEFKFKTNYLLEGVKEINYSTVTSDAKSTWKI